MVDNTMKFKLELDTSEVRTELEELNKLVDEIKGKVDMIKQSGVLK